MAKQIKWKCDEAIVLVIHFTQENASRFASAI